MYERSRFVLWGARGSNVATLIGYPCIVGCYTSSSGSLSNEDCTTGEQVNSHPLETWRNQIVWNSLSLRLSCSSSEVRERLAL